MNSAVIDDTGLRQLVRTLIDSGYRVVGSTLRDDAIVLAKLSSAGQLPVGWGVDVGPGHYRRRRRDDDAVFGHSAGPQSWKQFLHPHRQKVWSSDGEEPDEPFEVRRTSRSNRQRTGCTRSKRSRCPR
jgi:hypothetical protein